MSSRVEVGSSIPIKGKKTKKKKNGGKREDKNKKLRERENKKKREENKAKRCPKDASSLDVRY